MCAQSVQWWHVDSNLFVRVYLCVHSQFSGGMLIVICLFVRVCFYLLWLIN